MGAGGWPLTIFFYAAIVISISDSVNRLCLRHYDISIWLTQQFICLLALLRLPITAMHCLINFDCWAFQHFMCGCRNGIWRNEVVNIPPKMARGKYPSLVPQISPNESVCQTFLSGIFFLNFTNLIYTFWNGKTVSIWSCERLLLAQWAKPWVGRVVHFSTITMQDLVRTHNASTAKLPQLSKHFPLHLIFCSFFLQIKCVFLSCVSKWTSLKVTHI